MKKSFILRIAILGFFLAGLNFISSQQLSAQSTIDQTFSIPQETFVAPAEAMQRLDNAIVPMKNALLTLTEGTTEYKQMWAKYSCFNEVHNSIVGGKTVAESIVEGLKLVATDLYEIRDKSTLPAYRQELINLLRA